MTLSVLIKGTTKVFAHHGTQLHGSSEKAHSHRLQLRQAWCQHAVGPGAQTALQLYHAVRSQSHQP